MALLGINATLPVTPDLLVHLIVSIYCYTHIFLAFFTAKLALIGIDHLHVYMFCHNLHQSCMCTCIYILEKYTCPACIPNIVQLRHPFYCDMY